MSRYNITSCAVCNYPLGDEWQPEKVCPYCSTRYDLVNRKVDTSKTLVMPSDCRHRNTLFITGRTDVGEGGAGRYTVTVCPDCGEFRVFGMRDGVSFDVMFNLSTADVVAAAGKWHQLLESGDYKMKDKRKLFGTWMRREN